MICLSVFNHIVFDLDRTIWDTYDKYQNLIWAKQLIQPFQLINDDIITDDVGNRCVLRFGVRELLRALHNEKKRISFLSVGRIQNFPDYYQPSLHVLDLFKISEYFGKDSVLEYKTEKKSKHFPLDADLNSCVFLDDCDIHLADIAQLGVKCVLNTSKISNYKNLYAMNNTRDSHVIR